MNDPNYGVTCGECGSAMVLKTSRFGPFWGCRRYQQETSA